MVKYNLELPLNEAIITACTNGGVENFDSLSEIEKKKLLLEGRLPATAYMKISYSEAGNIVLRAYTTKITYIRGIFIKRCQFTTMATITPKKVFVSNKDLPILIDRICYVGIYINANVHTKTALRILVTKGKTAYQEFSKKYKEQLNKGIGETFQLGHANIPIKVLQQYCEGDIKEFLNMSSIEGREEYSPYILKDTLEQAFILNKKVKVSWSWRKVNDIHSKWSYEIALAETAHLSETNIWDNLPTLPPAIELLNTEKRIGLEGATMKHCIYSNYRNTLRNRKAVAFHVHYPGFVKPLTIMYYINSDGTFKFSQMYHKCNESVDLGFRQAIKDAVEPIIEELLKLNHIKRKTLYTPPVEEFDWDAYENNDINPI